MTFDAARYCRLAKRYEKQEEAPFTLGEAGRLEVVFLQAGTAALPGSAARFLAAGSLLVFEGPLSLEPAGEIRLCGVSLAGLAAKEAAAGLKGALVPPLPQSRKIVEQFFGLLQPEGQREPEAPFALLCALAAAPAGAADPPPLVSAALGRMHAQYAEVYGVEELAEELGVSKGHLIRSFRKALGLAPGRYLTLLRIEAAKYLLLQEEALPLEVVAGLCGFSGANYFCRVFKKEVGRPPAGWRRENAGTVKTGEAGEELQALYL